MLDTTTPTAENQQTFRGATMRDAFDAVKRVFGPDAIIVATRAIRATGYRPGEIEVDARRPSPSELTPAPVKATPASVLLARTPAKAPAKSEPRAPLATSLAPSFAAPSFAAAAPGARAGGFLAPPRDSIAAPAAPVVTVAPAASLGATSGATTGSGAPRASIVSANDLLRTALEDAGTSPLVARRVVELAARLPNKSGDVVSDLKGAMRALVATSSAPWTATKAASGRRIVALIGPTGVGKTTSIAKIAARAILDEGLRVALISLDTYRIGAVEQLARYGEILGVSTVVAKNKQQLQQAIDDAADADLILIDSAGRGPSDGQALDEQVALVKAVTGVELHLTLAVSSDERALARTRARWERFGATALIVTKLDEAEDGAALSTAAILGLPIACATNGQRVPEDIERFDAGALAALSFAADSFANAKNGAPRA